MTRTFALVVVFTAFALLTFATSPASAQDKFAQAPSPATTASRPPGLPTDLELPAYTLVPLAEEIKLPKGIIGVHVGKLNDVLNVALIVEEVTSPTMFRGRYVWGVAPEWKVDAPGSNTIFGEIQKGKLVFSRRAGLEKHEYKIGRDGQLVVEINVFLPDGSRRGGSSAKLQRIVTP